MQLPRGSDACCLHRHAAAGINWATLHQSRAPNTPRVDHELDTQNFEQFDEDMASAGAGASGGRGAHKWQTRAADPHFIGYTYKNWEAVHSDGATGQVRRLL
jgi:serine/threonine kinase 38